MKDSKVPGVRRLPLLALVVILAAVPGCITRTIKTKIQEDQIVTVLLRHDQKGSQVVEREYQQPAQISEDRLARILSAIYIRSKEDKSNQQRTAVPSSLLYPIAKALSNAFSKADSNQEVAVMAIRKYTRVGVFARKYLTSFTAWVKDDAVYIQFSRVEWNLDEAKKKKNEKLKFPEPDPTKVVMEFKTLPSVGIARASQQGVYAYWRDKRWSQSSLVTRSGAGQVKRRTVLMESDMPADEELVAEDREALPEDADTLRALADLEDARRSGDITEAEYRHKKAALLE